MARTCRFQFHLGPFRAAFLALLLVACASGTAKAGTKAEHLYLLDATPTLYSTRGFPVWLYGISGGHLARVRQVSPTCYRVLDDLGGHLYVLGMDMRTLSVLDEEAPAKVDVIYSPTGTLASRVPPFAGGYNFAWGGLSGSGVPPGVVYAGRTNHWAIARVFANGTPGQPRITPGDPALYRDFRYAGPGGGPYPRSIPAATIEGNRIMMPYTLGGGFGYLESIPRFLPPKAGASARYPSRPRGAIIVADTKRFFAFNAPLPSTEVRLPRTVYVLNRVTGHWSVIKLDFYDLWPRLFGAWLATTVQEPDKEGRVSPGMENERAREVDEDVPGGMLRELPRIRGMYRSNVYMPGKLLLRNLVDGRKLTIDTGQQDSEVLDVRKDGLVLYRVNDAIFSAHIEGDKLTAPKLVVKGEDVPEVHWVFWSKAGTEPQTLAEGAAHKRPPITLRLEAPKQPFSVTLEPPNKPLKVGAELRLRVTVKNISNRDITFIRSVTYGINTYEGFRYMIHVLDSKAHPAPPSARIVALRQVRQSKRPPVPVSGFIENHSRKLKPGQSFVDEIDITRYYDLSQPGVYRIWVTRPMPPKVTPHGVERPKGSIRSNTITVTVVK